MVKRKPDSNGCIFCRIKDNDIFRFVLTGFSCIFLCLISVSSNDLITSNAVRSSFAHTGVGMSLSLQDIASLVLVMLFICFLVLLSIGYHHGPDSDQPKRLYGKSAKKGRDA